MEMLEIEVAMEDLPIYDSSCIIGAGPILMCPNPPDPAKIPPPVFPIYINGKNALNNENCVTHIDNSLAETKAIDANLKRSSFIEIEVKHFSFDEGVLVERPESIAFDDFSYLNSCGGYRRRSEELEAIKDMKSQLARLFVNNINNLEFSRGQSLASPADYQKHIEDREHIESKSNSFSNDILSANIDSLSDDVFESESQTEARKEKLMFALHRTKARSNIFIEEPQEDGNSRLNVLQNSSYENGNAEKNNVSIKGSDKTADVTIGCLEKSDKSEREGGFDGSIYETVLDTFNPHFEDCKAHFTNYKESLQSLSSSSTNLTSSTESGSYYLYSLFDSEAEVDRKEEIMVLTRRDSFQHSSIKAYEQNKTEESYQEAIRNKKNCGSISEKQHNKQDIELTKTQSLSNSNINDENLICSGSYSLQEELKSNESSVIKYDPDVMNQGTMSFDKSETEFNENELNNCHNLESMSVSVDLEICVKVGLGTPSTEDGSLSSVSSNNSENDPTEFPVCKEYNFSAYARMQKERGIQKYLNKRNFKDDTAEQLARQIVQSVLFASQKMVAATADRAINERSIYDSDNMYINSDYNSNLTTKSLIDHKTNCCKLDRTEGFAEQNVTREKICVPKSCSDTCDTQNVDFQKVSPDETMTAHINCFESVKEDKIEGKSLDDKTFPERSQEKMICNNNYVKNENCEVEPLEDASKKGVGEISKDKMDDTVEVKHVTEKDHENGLSEDLIQNETSERISVSVDLDICVRVDLGSPINASDSELSLTQVNNLNSKFPALEQPTSNDDLSGYILMSDRKEIEMSEEPENSPGSSAEKIAKQIVEGVLFASQSLVEDSSCIEIHIENTDIKEKNNIYVDVLKERNNVGNNDDNNDEVEIRNEGIHVDDMKEIILEHHDNISNDGIEFKLKENAKTFAIHEPESYWINVDGEYQNTCIEHSDDNLLLEKDKNDIDVDDVEEINNDVKIVFHEPNFNSYEKETKGVENGDIDAICEAKNCVKNAYNSESCVIEHDENTANDKLKIDDIILAIEGGDAIKNDESDVIPDIQGVKERTIDENNVIKAAHELKLNNLHAVDKNKSRHVENGFAVLEQEDNSLKIGDKKSCIPDNLLNKKLETVQIDRYFNHENEGNNNGNDEEIATSEQYYNDCIATSEEVNNRKEQIGKTISTKFNGKDIDVENKSDSKLDHVNKPMIELEYQGASVENEEGSNPEESNDVAAMLEPKHIDMNDYKQSNYVQSDDNNFMNHSDFNDTDVDDTEECFIGNYDSKSILSSEHNHKNVDVNKESDNEYRDDNTIIDEEKSNMNIDVGKESNIQVEGDNNCIVESDSKKKTVDVENEINSIENLNKNYLYEQGINVMNEDNGKGSHKIKDEGTKVKDEQESNGVESGECNLKLEQEHNDISVNVVDDAKEGNFEENDDSYLILDLENNGVTVEDEKEKENSLIDSEPSYINVNDLNQASYTNNTDKYVILDSENIEKKSTNEEKNVNCETNVLENKDMNADVDMESRSTVHVERTAKNFQHDDNHKNLENDVFFDSENIEKKSTNEVKNVNCKTSVLENKYINADIEMENRSTVHVERTAKNFQHDDSHKNLDVVKGIHSVKGDDSIATHETEDNDINIDDEIESNFVHINDSFFRIRFDDEKESKNIANNDYNPVFDTERDILNIGGDKQGIDVDNTDHDSLPVGEGNEGLSISTVKNFNDFKPELENNDIKTDETESNREVSNDDAQDKDNNIHLEEAKENINDKENVNKVSLETESAEINITDDKENKQEVADKNICELEPELNDINTDDKIESNFVHISDNIMGINFHDKEESAENIENNPFIDTEHDRMNNDAEIHYSDVGNTDNDLLHVPDKNKQVSSSEDKIHNNISIKLKNIDISIDVEKDSQGIRCDDNDQALDSNKDLYEAKKINRVEDNVIKLTFETELNAKDIDDDKETKQEEANDSICILESEQSDIHFLDCEKESKYTETGDNRLKLWPEHSDIDIHDADEEGSNKKESNCMESDDDINVKLVVEHSDMNNDDSYVGDINNKENNDLNRILDSEHHCTNVNDEKQDIVEEKSDNDPVLVSGYHSYPSLDTEQDDYKVDQEKQGWCLEYEENNLIVLPEKVSNSEVMDDSCSKFELENSNAGIDVETESSYLEIKERTVIDDNDINVILDDAKENITVDDDDNEASHETEDKEIKDDDDEKDSNDSSDNISKLEPVPIYIDADNVDADNNVDDNVKETYSLKNCDCHPHLETNHISISVVYNMSESTIVRKSDSYPVSELDHQIINVDDEKENKFIENKYNNPLIETEPKSMNTDDVKKGHDINNTDNYSLPVPEEDNKEVRNSEVTDDIGTKIDVENMDRSIGIETESNRIESDDNFTLLDNDIYLDDAKKGNSVENDVNKVSLETEKGDTNIVVKKESNHDKADEREVFAIETEQIYKNNDGDEKKDSKSIEICLNNVDLEEEQNNDTNGDVEKESNYGKADEKEVFAIETELIDRNVDGDEEKDSKSIEIGLHNVELEEEQQNDTNFDDEKESNHEEVDEKEVFSIKTEQIEKNVDGDEEKYSKGIEIGLNNVELEKQDHNDMNVDVEKESKHVKADEKEVFAIETELIDRNVDGDDEKDSKSIEIGLHNVELEEEQQNDTNFDDEKESNHEEADEKDVFAFDIEQIDKNVDSDEKKDSKSIEICLNNVELVEEEHNDINIDDEKQDINLENIDNNSILVQESLCETKDNNCSIIDPEHIDINFDDDIKEKSNTEDVDKNPLLGQEHIDAHTKQESNSKGANVQVQNQGGVEENSETNAILQKESNQVNLECDVIQSESNCLEDSDKFVILEPEQDCRNVVDYDKNKNSVESSNSKIICHQEVNDISVDEIGDIQKHEDYCGINFENVIENVFEEERSSAIIQEHFDVNVDVEEVGSHTDHERIDIKVERDLIKEDIGYQCVVEGIENAMYPKQDEKEFDIDVNDEFRHDDQNIDDNENMPLSKQNKVKLVDNETLGSISEPFAKTSAYWIEENDTLIKDEAERENRMQENIENKSILETNNGKTEDVDREKYILDTLYSHRTNDTGQSDLSVEDEKENHVLLKDENKQNIKQPENSSGNDLEERNKQENIENEGEFESKQNKGEANDTFEECRKLDNIEDKNTIEQFVDMNFGDVGESIKQENVDSCSAIKTKQNDDTICYDKKENNTKESTIDIDNLNQNDFSVIDDVKVVRSQDNSNECDQVCKNNNLQTEKDIELANKNDLIENPGIGDMPKPHRYDNNLECDMQEISENEASLGPCGEMALTDGEEKTESKDISKGIDNMQSNEKNKVEEDRKDNCDFYCKIDKKMDGNDKIEESITEKFNRNHNGVKQKSESNTKIVEKEYTSTITEPMDKAIGHPIDKETISKQHYPCKESSSSGKTSGSGSNTSWNNQEEKIRNPKHKTKEEHVYSSDESDDDIDDSGQYHPELYTRMVDFSADINEPIDKDEFCLKEIEKIIGKLEDGTDRGKEVNKLAETNLRDDDEKKEVNAPERKHKMNLKRDLHEEKNCSEDEDSESSETIDDTGQYHPELYEKEWIVNSYDDNSFEESTAQHKRGKPIELFTEMRGISAVDIDLEEAADDEPVDPNIVKEKLEKWIKTERDSSIKKETERFINEGMPGDQHEIKQKMQAKYNVQRRQHDRNINEVNKISRHNSQEGGYRSRHSSQDSWHQMSRRSSQEGGHRSRQLSQEEIYARSRQNSVEGIYDRGRELGDYTRQGVAVRTYQSRRHTSHEHIARPESFKGREGGISRDVSRQSSREGFYDERNYVSPSESYARSRHGSGEETLRKGERFSRHGSQEKSHIYKRKDNYERSESCSSEKNFQNIPEELKCQRKNVIEKGTLSRHDDLYERRQLSRRESLELVHERNERNQGMPQLNEGFMEGRLGRKSDYIEVKKFRKDTKHGLGSDKKKADFLTSAQLKIFCQPPKSQKPTAGHVDMLSVSIERPKRKENERKNLVNSTEIEKTKNLPEYDTDSFVFEAKNFDVYRYEKQEKKGGKSNLKSDQYRRAGNQYSGQFNESGFPHKDNKLCQIYNRNVDIAASGSLEPNNVIDPFAKNRCALKHEAGLRTKSLVANSNLDNGENFYSSNSDYVHSRSKYHQNLGGRKCPKSIDGAKDKGRMKIPTNSGETSKDGPLSLTDTFAPMDRGHNDTHNLSQSQGKLSDSTTSLNNRQAPAKSPSRQNTLVKQTSVQSNQSELNGEKKDDPHGIKFERLKNLEEDELMAKIKEIIGHLEKLEDYHRGDGMRIQKMLGDMYWDYTHLREMIADCMAENGYAVVSMKMLKTLNGIGIFKNDDVWFPTYYTYNTMWNFSDASSNLAKALSENDAVRLLTLNCGHKPYINALHSKNVFYVIKASLSILHNMARNSGMKHLFDENKTSETIMPFMDSEDEMLKILATLTIANIVDEEENKAVIAETGTIHCMVSWIEKAISLPRRRFKGFTPQELTEGLNKLAVNDSNKMRIVEESSLPMFLLMLQHEDVREQSSAARIIWTLSFDKDVRQKLLENSDLISTLEKLTESTNKSVQQNANGALWIIKGENDISRESKPKGTPTKSHVFLSYSWSDKDTVLQIRDKLRAEGYAIWIDIEKGSAASLEGMANAIENSAVVLICMSEKYKQNPNCRTEAEYTFQLKKDYIPLMLQKKYRPDGWLGFILGAKLYFDFSGKYPFEKSLTGLLKELRGRGQVTPNTTPVGSNETSDGNMVTSQSLTSYASPGTPVPSNSVLLSMGQEELVKWLRVVKLTECIPAFLEFDGRLLLQLKQMRTEAPEFFYQCLEKRLNMSLIEILKFTRALEELH